MVFFSFELNGDFAIFKKPDINNVYLSYNFIPIPSLLGIFGAINGYGGIYKRYITNEENLEYYIKFGGIYLGIEPLYNQIEKQIVNYNNSTGYANKGEENLVIHEQILIKPKWRIYVYDENDSEEISLLYKNIKQNRTIFTPYLGKNEFIVSIENFVDLDLPLEYIELKKENLNDKNQITTLIPKNLFYDIFERSSYNNDEEPFELIENLPISLDNLRYKHEKVLQVRGNIKIKNSSQFDEILLKIKDRGLLKIKNKNEKGYIIFLFKV